MRLADDSRSPELPAEPSLRLPQDASTTGPLLRLKSGTTLPPRCIYCSAPVETGPQTIPIQSSQKTNLTLQAHLCEVHRLVRAQIIVSVIGTLLMTGSAAGFAWLRGAGLPIVGVITVAGLLGAWLRAIVIGRRTPPLRLDRIEGDSLYIAGCGPAFLDTLPKAAS